ncbi:class I SAM-dependent methyltransferase [Lapillicoccus jejuensis]|uniref:Methyltransferase family protein n=1 Tax=Lapillicoccus jejuensis TaxID=402171 RepID=A0A542E4V9_9MICO|nr:class I SAM-dependent methyltransferase [Lapillicoccus jejuensis]TQJ10371.1 methyltransferase family protein [Lapillicoccus jejuensis]
MRPPDAHFADPRQAVLYDDLDGSREDLDAYLALVDELGARTVADVGCGTGSLPVLLVARGIEVVGVDPARASLDVARSKPGAERVRWVEGDATALVGLGVTADLAVMTGNVAQVFVDDADWDATLTAVAAVVRDGGWLVLETRRTAARAWEGWDVEPTPVDLPDGRTALVSRQVTEVALPLVTFTGRVELEGEVLSSTSTLRFRERDELGRDLARHGFAVAEVRQAPDRPGLEHVVLARRVG